MKTAKKGDTVKVHYTGKLEDGTVFDTSVDHEPLQFTIGEGRLLSDFEQSVIGMKTGDSKSVDIPSENAYGPHHEEMVIQIDRSQVPPHIDPEVGQQLEIRHPNNQVIKVTVTEVSNSNISLDANHPLAGKDLIFEIELVEIGE